MMFSYNDFLNKLKEREKSKKPLEFSIDELCAHEKNPIPNVYSDSKKQSDFLSNTQNFTYYRIEPLKVAYYRQHVPAVVFLLPTFEKEGDVKNYFGDLPQNLAPQVKEGDLLLLMGRPDTYRNEIAKKIYEPLFQELSNNQDYWPLYANRLEDILAKQKGHDSWDDFKSSKSKKLRVPNPEKPVTIGQLRHKNPTNFFTERIAWLKLLDLDGPAKTLETTIPRNRNLAEKMAFIFHSLFTAPIFYARKGLCSIDVDYDLSAYRETIEEFMKYEKPKPLDQKVWDNIKSGFTYVRGFFKGTMLHKDDIDRRPEAPLVTAAEDTPSYEVYERLKNRELDKLTDKGNNLLCAYKTNFLGGGVEDVDKIRKQIQEVKSEIMEAYRKAFIGDRRFKFDTTTTTIALGLGGAGGMILAGPLGAFGVPFLIEIFKKTLVEKFLNPELEKKWGEGFEQKIPFFNYIPTYYLWWKQGRPE